MNKTQNLKTLAIDLINEQSTMALATAKKDIAWAAPVYYVFYKSAFFFFSDPKSRHIQEASESEQVSAAIYPFADTWQGIRGIQMSGRIQSVAPGLTAVQAVRAYIAKFPFTKEFFKPGQALDLEGFAKQFRVRLYRLDPEQVFYLDNRIRFGFRETITF
jgi:uncharacterized protein YhbP (UPF0306 family)